METEYDAVFEIPAVLGTNPLVIRTDITCTTWWLTLLTGRGRSACMSPGAIRSAQAPSGQQPEMGPLASARGLTTHQPPTGTADMRASRTGKE